MSTRDFSLCELYFFVLATFSLAFFSLLALSLVGHRLIESSMDGLLAKGASQTCTEIAVFPR